MLRTVQEQSSTTVKKQTKKTNTKTVPPNGLTLKTRQKRARPSDRWNDRSFQERLAFCRRTQTTAAANNVAENQSMSEHRMTKKISGGGEVSVNN